MADEPLLRGHPGRAILSAFPPLWPVTYDVMNVTDPDLPGTVEHLFNAWTYSLYAHYMLETCHPAQGNCWSPDYCPRGRKLWAQELEYRKTWNDE